MQPENTAILCFPEYTRPARKLAELLNIPCLMAELHTFPDGESWVHLPQTLPERVVLCRSLFQPNNKLIEIIFAASTARDLGAGTVELVAPYLCYMRQDTAFTPGEVVSQKIIADILCNQLDAIYTVDPHLHRISNLKEVYTGCRATSISASSLIGEYIGEHTNNPVLVGPDQESEQWVRSIADPLGFEFTVASKNRIDDHTVQIELPDFDFTNRETVIVDDIASTGQTVANTARALKQKTASSVHIMVTHALFIDDAEITIRSAGVDNIWSTDSIPHHSNVISLAPLLAQEIRSRKQDK
jgi:ribose-phosphate pyrophosphokinase